MQTVYLEYMIVQHSPAQMNKGSTRLSGVRIWRATTFWQQCSTAIWWRCFY